jgi:hypothetical protein
MALMIMILGNNIVQLWISTSINISFLMWLGFGFLLLYIIIDSYFSSMMLTKYWLKVTIKYYPIATSITIVLKLLLIKTMGVPALLFTPLLVFSIFYFLPVYQKMQKLYYV